MFTNPTMTCLQTRASDGKDAKVSGQSQIKKQPEKPAQDAMSQLTFTYKKSFKNGTKQQFYKRIAAVPNLQMTIYIHGFPYCFASVM